MERRSFFGYLLAATGLLFVADMADAGVRRLKRPEAVTLDDVIATLEDEFPGRNFKEKVEARAATRRGEG